MFFHSPALTLSPPFSNSPSHSSTPDDFLIPILNLIQQPKIYSLMLSPDSLILIYTIQLLYHLSHQPTYMSYHVTSLPTHVLPLYEVPSRPWYSLMLPPELILIHPPTTLPSLSPPNITVVPCHSCLLSHSSSSSS